MKEIQKVQALWAILVDDGKDEGVLTFNHRAIVTTDKDEVSRIKRIGKTAKNGGFHVRLVKFMERFDVEEL